MKGRERGERRNGLQQLGQSTGCHSPVTRDNVKVKVAHTRLSPSHPRVTRFTVIMVISPPAVREAQATRDYVVLSFLKTF